MSLNDLLCLDLYVSSYIKLYHEWQNKNQKDSTILDSIILVLSDLKNNNPELNDFIDNLVIDLKRNINDYNNELFYKLRSLIPYIYESPYDSCV